MGGVYSMPERIAHVTSGLLVEGCDGSRGFKRALWVPQCSSQEEQAPGIINMFLKSNSLISYVWLHWVFVCQVSLVLANGGYFLVAGCGLLTAVASLVEHRLCSFSCNTWI